MELKYDGRLPEPPYEFTACNELKAALAHKDAVIEELAGMASEACENCAAMHGDNQPCAPGCVMHPLRDDESIVAEAERRVEGKTK